jgi:prephenate dehydratase/prephenate dehydrogenase
MAVDEKHVRVAYLGPEGTYTQQAASHFFPEAFLHPCVSIPQVFQSVQQHVCTYGVVPLENVVQGAVTETLDALYQYATDIHVVDAWVMPVEHALGAHVDVSKITRVLSKDQALQQCASFLNTHFPHAERVHTPSTAAAVAMVAENPHSTDAAVANASALRAAGLNVLFTQMGPVRNKTRFVVIAPRAQVPVSHVRPARTGLILYPRYDRIGLLRDILHIVSTLHGLSCSAIQSRPDERGAFRFYLEIEGHTEDTCVHACIQDLKTQLALQQVEVWVYGVYPKTWFNPPTVRSIALLGGTGRMGRWLHAFFQQAGYEVTSVGREGFQVFLQQVPSYDVVLVNVPIPQTCDVVAQVAPRMVSGQLLVDNTSVKIQPVQAMLQHAPEGVEVLGMHTLFGPSVPKLAGENVVFTHTPRMGVKCAEFESIFQLYGARVSYCTPTFHDQQMAFHQNIEHFTKLVTASLLSEQGVSLPHIEAFASPNSRASLATLKRILNNDPALLAQIQHHNSMALPMVRQFVAHAQRLLHVIEQGTEEECVAYIQTFSGIQKML